MGLIKKYSQVPIGKIFSHLDYKLLSNKKNKNRGELLISGSQLMNGYINRDSNNELFKYKNKIYYKTGDLVEKKNGYFFLIDRLNNLVKFKGYRFNPNYVDDILIKSSEIVDSKTIIYDHKIRGQFLISFISSKFKNINKFRTLITKNIPSYISPFEIIRLKKIPLNNSGKYDKNKLIKLSNDFFSK